MAEVIQYDESAGTSTTSSATFQNKATIGPWTPEGTSEWLIVACCEFGGDADNDIGEVRLYDGTTVHSLSIFEFDEVASVIGKPFATAVVVTLTATSTTFNLQYRLATSVDATPECAIQNARILAIPLNKTTHDPVPSQEDDTLDSFTATTYGTERERLTFTAVAGEYLVLIAGQLRGTTTNGQSVAARVMMDGTSEWDTLLEMEDNNDLYPFINVSRENFGAGSTTIDLDVRSEGGSEMDWNYVHLYAIHMDDLGANGAADDQFAENLTYTTESTTTPENVVSLNWTPDTATDYYVLGSCVYGGDASPTDGGERDLYHGATLSQFRMTGTDDSDRPNWLVMDKLNLAASSQTIHMRVWESNAGTPDPGMGPARLVAFREAAAGGADVTISVPLETLTLTEQTPTVDREDDHLISVPLETLTLTEQTPTIGHTHKISVPLETLTLTEQTPNIKVAINISVPTETLVLAEQTPVVTRDYTVSVPVETLTLTEQAPTVIREDDHLISVPTDTLTLVEQTPTVASTDFPSPFGNLNENKTLVVDTTYLIRVRVENSGGLGGTDFRWAFNHNSGGDTPVTTVSDEIKAVAAVAFNEGDDVTEILGGSGSYIADNNGATEDGTSSLTSAFTVSGAAEFVLAFKIDGAASGLANGQTGTIRLERGDGTDLNTYSQTFTYTVSGVSASVTVNVPTETLALSEQTPTIGHTHKISVAGETLSLTEQTLTVEATDDHPINVPVETLTLAEAAPSLRFDYRVPAETLTLSEFAPTIGHTHKISIPAETLTLSENAPSLNFSISIPAETLALAEAAPTIGHTHKIPVPVEALLLTEQAPSLAFDYRVPSDALTLSEQAPTIGHTHKISVPVETLSLSEQTPTVLREDDHPISVPLETLTLAEQTPTIDLTHNVNVPLETLTLTENAPTASITINIIVPLETLTLVEFAPTVGHTHKIPVSAETLALAEQTPTIGHTHKISVPLETLTLAEQTPTIGHTHKISVPAETLVLAEQTPTVTRDYTVAVPTAELTLTEQTPVVARDYTVAVPTATVTLTESAPEIGLTGFRIIPLETLSLTTASPTVKLTNRISVPAVDLSLSEQTPTVLREDKHLISLERADIVFESFAPTIQAWGEVPTDDAQVWTEILTGSETWSSISTSDAHSWTEVSTGTKTWTQVPTSDTEIWTEIETKP